ncbi:Alpha-glucosidase, glycosyl hydrolase family GH31 [Marinilactibacillus piezotolerans]|uniref:Alpha-glucosidase, glycosyl hydrolase family GH31 n=1 Tax=Marinilactibacillus piezotolerans TaxID=258723 RepID=A0A1I3ZVX2_9LACT|nr:TIM-barrel domain-containing protein [Marinilactibacillus piezotolerans]SFK48050.1 Alpha-glucosidase, glycosyl hydrolase family GH31 [Marinilactibacillus piezotolerans]
MNGNQGNNIIKGNTYRFTVLTNKLLRMEYSKDGIFEDRPTQIIKNRDLGDVDFELKETHQMIEIITDSFHLRYMKEKEFSPKNLSIDVRYNYTNYTNRWYFGQYIPTLKGALRTVDKVDGEAPLEESIISKYGYATLDDSKSFVFDENEDIKVKNHTQTDMYFFAYGREYLKAVQDFYRLSGHPPLLPRYALGNWWSRYWRYTEESYLKLIDKFEEDDIPLAVSVIDMDWHLTDVPSKYGSGWTGYTWNRELFPNPERFLKRLQDKGLAVTLNVHPADGIRAFEEQYEVVAEKLDLNTAIEEPAHFDLMDDDFRQVYFEDVHHPMEEQGVDFWWIDWQQGEFSSSDIDPLWLLNHYHFKDMKERGKDGLILSRYGGPGSHRYPVGFSGDAIITWDSLRFQPYLTTTSSNIGYTWWSHDIGGHFKGYKDEELTLRWFQFGVFSPINRLHSSNSAFSSKEPWKYSIGVRNNMTEFLRLRHALIPYLYTHNVENSEKGIPVIQPVYYKYPHEESAYNIKNEYFFGSELLVLPVTSKKDEETLHGSEVFYFPDGHWFDVFSNFRYKGQSELKLFRDETTIPVFAKEGSIVPLDPMPAETDAHALPKDLDWLIYPGASNRFELVEDADHQRALTIFDLDHSEQKLSIHVEGEKGMLPEERKHVIHFNASNEVKILDVENGEVEAFAFDKKLNRTSVTLKPEGSGVLTVMFDGFNPVEQQDISEELFKRLDKAQVGYFLKDDLLNAFNSDLSDFSLLALINELEEEKLSQSLFELLYIKNS